MSSMWFQIKVISNFSMTMAVQNEPVSANFDTELVKFDVEIN